MNIGIANLVCLCEVVPFIKVKNNTFPRSEVLSITYHYGDGTRKCYTHVRPMIRTTAVAHLLYLTKF